MIDDKMLADREGALINRDLAEKAYCPPSRIPNSQFAEDAEIIRNARRYLALRNAAKTQEGRVKVQAIFWHMACRKDIDAAADRLLESGE